MYREIFKKSADGMLIVENDKFIDCNDSVVEMLKYNNKQELLDTHPSELSPPMQPGGVSSFDKANEMIQKVLANGSHSFEWIHLRANGEPFWVEVVATKMSEDDSKDLILLVVWREIGEKKRLEEENSYQHMLLNAVLNSSVDLIFYKDYQTHDGRYIGCNDAFGKLVGREQADIIGENDFELFGEELGSFFREKDKEVIEAKQTISNEEWVTYPNGDKVLLHTTKSLLKSEIDDTTIGVLGISRDMTKEYNYKEQLEQNIKRQTMLSELDPLTNIKNRRAFFDISEELLKVCIRNDSPSTLLMIDIDFFKDVNDTYGHLIGDDILKYVVNTIRTRLRESDLFGRFGGEEFVVFLPNTNLEGGLEIAKTIRLLFADTPYRDGKLSIPITVSIGVYERINETLMRQIVQKSDTALYKAKQNGRNRVESYVETS